MYNNLKENLINENEGYDELSPLHRLMRYRNDENAIDCDRSKTAFKVYKIMFPEMSSLESDTFFISPYNDVYQLCQKQDREQKSRYYVESFKTYIESLQLDYNDLTPIEADYQRKNWFCDLNTIEHYSFLSSEIIMNYIDAGHKIGNFMLIPKKYGWHKCRQFEDKGILALRDLENNWVEYRAAYNNISFQDFIKIFVLQEVYSSTYGNLDFNFDMSWNEIYDVMKDLTRFVNNRTESIIDLVKNKERGTK